MRILDDASGPATLSSSSRGGNSGLTRIRKKHTLSPAALTLEVAIATNILLALVALLLLVLSVSLVGLWENSTTWRKAPHAPVIEPEPRSVQSVI